MTQGRGGCECRTVLCVECFSRIWHALLGVYIAYLRVCVCVCVLYGRSMSPTQWTWRWRTPRCGFLPRSPSLTQTSCLTPRSGRFASSCLSTGSIPPPWPVRAGGNSASKCRLLRLLLKGIPTGWMQAHRDGMIYQPYEQSAWAALSESGRFRKRRAVEGRKFKPFCKEITTTVNN